MATGKMWMSPQKQDAGGKRIKTFEDDVASIVSHAIEAQQKAMHEMVFVVILFFYLYFIY